MINNIIQVKLSKKKPKLIFITSIRIQVNNLIKTIESLKQTSKYKNKEIIAEMNRQKTENFVLISLPK